MLLSNKLIHFNCEIYIRKHLNIFTYNLRLIICKLSLILIVHDLLIAHSHKQM